MIVNAPTYNFKTESEQLLTMFLDSGSQYIRLSTALNLGSDLTNLQQITILTFGGYQQTEASYQVSVTVMDQSNKPMHLKLWTREFITSIPRYSSTLVSNCATSKEAYPSENINVDILIGIEYYWNIVDSENMQQLPSGLTLVPTKFGPILAGIQKYCAFSCASSLQSSEEHGDEDATEILVRQLLGLRNVGISDDLTSMNAEVVQQYYDSVKIVDGFIYVRDYLQALAEKTQAYASPKRGSRDWPKEEQRWLQPLASSKFCGSDTPRMRQQRMGERCQQRNGTTLHTSHTSSLSISSVYY
ncbi:hypothetical protein Aduo_008734 [Ancylostoma duodenale]